MYEIWNSVSVCWTYVCTTYVGGHPQTPTSKPTPRTLGGTQYRIRKLWGFFCPELSAKHNTTDWVSRIVSYIRFEPAALKKRHCMMWLCMAVQLIICICCEYARLLWYQYMVLSCSICPIYQLHLDAPCWSYCGLPSRSTSVALGYFVLALSLVWHSMASRMCQLCSVWLALRQLTLKLKTVRPVQHFWQHAEAKSHEFSSAPKWLRSYPSDYIGSPAGQSGPKYQALLRPESSCKWPSHGHKMSEMYHRVPIYLTYKYLIYLDLPIPIPVSSTPVFLSWRKSETIASSRRRPDESLRVKFSSSLGTRWSWWALPVGGFPGSNSRQMQMNNSFRKSDSCALPLHFFRFFVFFPMFLFATAFFMILLKHQAASLQQSSHFTYQNRKTLAQAPCARTGNNKINKSKGSIGSINCS